MKTIIILIITITLSYVTFGQKNNIDKRKETIKAERIAFITSKIDLTPAEAQKFWPVYNEYINKQEDIMMQKRKNMRNFIKNQDNLTDKQTQDIIDKLILLKRQECNLFEDYNKKIEQILPIKKVALLYHSEKQFKRYLMKKMQSKKRHN